MFFFIKGQYEMNMGLFVLPNPYNALLIGEIPQFFHYEFALHWKNYGNPCGFPFPGFLAVQR